MSHRVHSPHNPKPQPGHFNNSTTRRPRSEKPLQTSGSRTFFVIFMFFDSKPGNCQPICGIISANKSFSSAKAALFCYFRARGKNRRHLGCPNIMRSTGCAVQNKGITLKTQDSYRHLNTCFRE